MQDKPLRTIERNQFKYVDSINGSKPVKQHALTACSLQLRQAGQLTNRIVDGYRVGLCLAEKPIFIRE